MANALETRHLSKRYRESFAVRDLSFAVPEGSLFSLLGPNGAGKSTTLGMLTTVIKPTAGEASVLGLDVVAGPHLIRSEIGVVFQNSMLDLELSVYENLAFQGRLHRIPREERLLQMAQAVRIAGLEHRSNDRVKNLSGGYRRRLEIARALVHKPSVLFLDEPTAGLDPDARQVIWRALQRIREETGLTIILTTHYLDEADTLSDDVAIIDHGQIKVQGSPDSLKAELGGDIVTARLLNAQSHLETQIKNLPKTEEVSLNNDALRFKIYEGEKRVPEIIKILQENSDSIKSFQIKAPTLDDVFLSVTGHSLKHENNS